MTTPPRVRPAPPPTTLERFDARRVREELEGEEARIQKTAENWRNGLATLLTLTLATAAFSSRDDLEELAEVARWITAGLATLSVAVAAYGLSRLLRAAYGRPRWVPRDGRPVEVADRDARRDAVTDLDLGIRATFIALALFVGALLTVRLGPESSDPQRLRVTVDGDEHCGTVVRTGDGVVVIKAGKVEQTVRLSEAAAVEPVSSCP